MVPLTFVILAVLPFLGQILFVCAQGGACNASISCPSSTPCCSEFGFCGTGASFCLGGCNPLWSHSPTSCEPAPLCKSATYTFGDNSRILLDSSRYNGDATTYDWILDKGDITNTNNNGGELALILTKTNGGTRVSSTRYIHYGTVTARLKTGRWGGVVSAFITMSGAKDEIDWEFPGNHTTEAQTNFYWLGVEDWTHGKTIQGVTDTYHNYHDYTVDWQPDTMKFLIDGKLVRTLSRSDLNDAYPSTPSRILISIWPAGLPSTPPGTLAWGGGLINWNDPDYLATGHFQTLIHSVSVTCADPAGTVPANAQSYVYGSNVTVGERQIPSVLVTNQGTIIHGP
ncbi:glycoside hydrolase family 16 protein [Ramaria rubella]|nr:glycoside hydrolase family 16 protein [Ramaria rubella]